jgi:hypothetical protein
MNNIALVFFTFWLHDPSVSTGPQTSDTLFESHQACAEFVNKVASGDVVDSNFEFKFSSSDGLVVYGGCYSAEEYTKKFIDKS